MPSPTELEHARRVVAAFESSVGVGEPSSLNGMMIDIAHLRAARRLLNGRKD